MTSVGVGRGGGGQADARADDGARIVERDGGGEIVDVDRVRRGRRLVAGDVGDDDLQVCGTVRERAGRERLAVGRAGRRRRLRAEDREGAGAGGLDLEADGRDTRSRRDRPVGRVRGDRDAAGDVRRPRRGEVTDPLAGVLSTVFGRPGSSSFATFPVLSVTTARRSYSPSATSVVLHEASYGGEMSAAPMLAQLLAPAGENWNWTELTSAALVE